MPTSWPQRAAQDVTPHVAQKVRAVRSMAAPGGVGLRDQPTEAEAVGRVFGWMKTIGGLRRLRHRGGELVDWIMTFTAAAYNLVRLRTLLARASCLSEPSPSIVAVTIDRHTWPRPSVE